jgi:hypothetical protein
LNFAVPTFPARFNVEVDRPVTQAPTTTTTTTEKPQVITPSRTYPEEEDYDYATGEEYSSPSTTHIHT